MNFPFHYSAIDLTRKVEHCDPFVVGTHPALTLLKNWNHHPSLLIQSYCIGSPSSVVEACHQVNWTCPIPKFFLPGLQLSPEFHMLSKPNRTPPSAWWLLSPPWRCKTLSIWTQCPQLLWNPEILPQVVVEVLLFSNLLLVWEYARESRKLEDYRNQLHFNLTKSACQV